MCRPLVICDDGRPRVTTDHINKLKAGEWGFTDFLKRGEHVQVTIQRVEVLRHHDAWKFSECGTHVAMHGAYLITNK